MTDLTPSFEQKCINTIKFLSADAIQKANSGHPGMPMGAAPMAYVLWTRFLKHNPADPEWPDRDRFVLSGGHASMLLYSLLHLTGYDLPLDQLKSFRQWGSKTPGHPEVHLTPGVEATTGPLGQGLSNGVGMALAEAHLSSRYNRPDFPVVDHYTYVLASDGDIMEGVVAEACSLAGHLGLGKLIVLYDDNSISLAGSTAISFSEDVRGRFESYGWQVLTVEDGTDLEAIDAAIGEGREETNRPTLIRVRTVIGSGAPTKQGTFGVHGSPLGDEELEAAKQNCGWPLEPRFLIPDEVRDFFRKALDRGAEEERKWRGMLDRFAAKLPEPAAEFERVIKGELPPGWEKDLPDLSRQSEPTATRVASSRVLKVLARDLPELMGGSADLNPSTKSILENEGDFQKPGSSPEGIQGRVGGPWGYEGRNIHFGIREHAMGSIAVGMALHGGVIPYTATFLVFSDYMRPPIRLAALSRVHAIFLFTHDSIGLGEDGPTHQPVEQLTALRTVPNLIVIRPADAAETVEAWKAALLNREGPVSLIFSRQKLPTVNRDRCASAAGLLKGGYVLRDPEAGEPEVILIGTGSEVDITLEAADILEKEGRRPRVVSLPSWELFDRQDREYRESVLPPEMKARVAVEAGVTLGWERYVGDGGTVIGVSGFGASAPAEVIYEKFGITPAAVADAARLLLGNQT